MRVEVIKGFATESECSFLSRVALEGVVNGQLISASDRPERFSNRRDCGAYKNPGEALQLQRRIAMYFGLEAFPVASQSGGSDGIVVSCIKSGGDVFRHIDPASGHPTATLRCNLLTKAADAGGELIVGNDKIEFKERDLVCFLVTETEHHVTKNTGSGPRILWQFGWYVPVGFWSQA